MNEKICTFFGHAQLWGAEQQIEVMLTQVCRKLVEAEEVRTFLLGNQGAFDRLTALALQKIKRTFPKIQRILVIPYLTEAINHNQEELSYLYDDILRPEELMGVHYKCAIGKRNRWMAERADIVVAYVVRNNGGAAAALRFAKRKNKTIIDLTCPQSY